MSDITPFEPGPEAEWEANNWHVRAAYQEDAPAVAAAVSDLLVELGGKPACEAELEQTTRAIIDDPDLGLVLVAEYEDEIVGVLGVSWQSAIRIPGRYGLIQELWVAPAWRYRTIGADLILTLCELAPVHDVTRLEVGLPGERFPHQAATESFYLNNGFTPIGLRMRRFC